MNEIQLTTNELNALLDTEEFMVIALEHIGVTLLGTNDLSDEEKDFHRTKLRTAATAIKKICKVANNTEHEEQITA